MALLEKEATRFAESLDDYEHVSVTDIGGWGPQGFWLVVRDERFDISYEIVSHCDYWDFIGALVDHRQCVALQGGGVMETQRFGVTTTVFVDATDAGEAALIIERDLAGRFDSDLVSVSGHVKSGDGATLSGLRLGAHRAPRGHRRSSSFPSRPG